MEVGNVAAVAKSIAAREGPKVQPELKSSEAAKKVATTPKAAGDATVSVSRGALDANKEKSAVASAADTSAQASGDAAKGKPELAPVDAKGSVATRRAYDLENGDLVVSILSDNEVVKQIPNEDQRKIKQAIAKYVADEAKGNAAPDVASKPAASDSSGVQKGEAAGKPDTRTVADLVA